LVSYLKALNVEFRKRIQKYKMNSLIWEGVL
jgi:hypothetical protein